MLDALRNRLVRLGFNLFPAYRGSGGRITHLAPDWQEIRVKIPHNWRTKNYVGTIYGGSIYGAVDPLYMMMLLKTLGDEYVVWDKEADVRFKKPGTSTLYATCTLTDEELDAIRAELESTDAIDRHYTIDVVDDSGTVHATVGKTLHVSTDRSKRA